MRRVNSIALQTRGAPSRSPAITVAVIALPYPLYLSAEPALLRVPSALDEDAVANNPLLSGASERNYEDPPPSPLVPSLAYDVDYPSGDHTYGGSNIMYVCTRAPYQGHRRRRRRPPSPSPFLFLNPPRRSRPLARQ